MIGNRLFGAVGVTLPGLYIILSQGSGDSHGHDDHADSHAKSHKEEESKDKPEAESKEEPEEKSEEPEAKDVKKDEKSEESKSEDDNTKESAPAAKDNGEKQGEGASTDEVRLFEARIDELASANTYRLLLPSHLLRLQELVDLSLASRRA